MDDDPYIRDIFKEGIQYVGYAYLTAVPRLRAIEEMLRNKARRYDAAVTETCLNLIIEKRLCLTGTRGSFEEPGGWTGFEQQFFPEYL